MYHYVMKAVKFARERHNLSQRRLADLASVSFRCVQIVESETGNPNIATLDKIATALGHRPGGCKYAVNHLLGLSQDSVFWISQGIYHDGESSWKRWLFEFVDAFRDEPGNELISVAPVPEISHRVLALIASTVESLCAQEQMTAPWWCAGIGTLSEPWFVSGSESLKASALVESSTYFRKRNIFVLGNFLERA